MPRMGAREPDAFDARHVVNRLQEAREITGGVIGRDVVVDDLSEELDFAPAAVNGTRVWFRSSTTS